MKSEPFEFSAEQNKIFQRLARLMKYAGILFIFLGVMIGTLSGVTILHQPLRGYGYLFLTILSVSFGVWTNSISYSFKLIAETSGQDITILMDALKTMKLVYTLQLIWLLIMTLASFAVLIVSTLSGYQIL
jgi:hypothetical protein